MSNTGTMLLLWVPRAAGLAMSMFLALFALDAFNGAPVFAALQAFAIHLVPSVVVLAIVAVSWRMPLFGAVAFAVLAAGYATMVGWRLDWVALIGGPLAALAALFFFSWRCRGSDSLRA